MSCVKCKEAQASSLSGYFRWEYGNVEIRGCDEHLGQVFDALRKSQETTHEGKVALLLRPESWRNIFDCVRGECSLVRGNFWASIQELERQLEEAK